MTIPSNGSGTHNISSAERTNYVFLMGTRYTPDQDQLTCHASSVARTARTAARTRSKHTAYDGCHQPGTDKPGR